MAESLNTRVARLERLVEVLADNQNRLDEALVVLTEAQIETQKQFRETERRFRETDERFRQSDERINALVSAIGEWFRRSSEKA
ncbi:MAG TPA: hypothetical protein VKU19_05705 [Bryobacteraceae bacterium]|nr:hypothetical protein [Bryobacteraceae bacterium]